MVRNKARESNNMVSVEKSAGRGFKSRPRLQFFLNPVFSTSLRSHFPYPLKSRERWVSLQPCPPHAFATPGLRAYRHRVLSSGPSVLELPVPCAMPPGPLRATLQACGDYVAPDI